MNNEELIAKAFESARREDAPRIDVTAEVMRGISERSEVPPAAFVRQLRLDAIVAVALALLVLIPAQRAAVTLMDPMLALFANVESGLR